MKKLYELDPSKEFNDGDINATSDGSIASDEITVGNFESVSGIGVADVDFISDEEQESNLQEILAKLNSRTDEEMLSDLEQQEREREQYRLEEEERLRQAKERFNRERYEKEQAALAKKREEDELARLEAEKEEELKKKKNPFFKFASGSGKKGKNADEDNFEIEEELEEETSTKKKSLFGKKKKPTKVEEVEEVVETVTKEPVKTVVAKPKETVVEDEPVLSEEEYAPEPEDVEMELQARHRNVVSSEEAIEIEEVELEATEEEPISLQEEVLEEEVTEESVEEETKAESSKKKFSMSSFLSAIPKVEKKEKPVKENVSKEKPSKVSSKGTLDNEPDWKYIATHDELTGLLNVRAYSDDLKRMPQKLGVVFFDINNLKYVNDTLFHEAGNQLIKGVADVVKSQFGENNLYRIGGDEFVYLIEKPSKGQADKVEEAIIKIHNMLETKTKSERDSKIIYSVSIGYAFGDGKATKEEVVKAAEASMYQQKKAYKLSHPDLDIRGQKAEEVKKDKPKAEHDDLLTKEQKQLKNKIKEEHEKVSKGSTQQIMREVQKRAGEIEAIFIASPSFDHLFVITDIDDFLDIMEQQQALIDYSYLYIVYQGGPQYYGADEYYKEVTHLFEEISDALMSGKFRSEKDIQNIPGINIFKNIYV